MTTTLDSWARAVNLGLPAGVRPFERELGGVRWSGWRATPPAGSKGRVVLLHGTGGARHSWRPVLDRLSASVEVLIPDLPGHGLTRCETHGRHGLATMAQDLEALLAAEGFDRAEVLVGHSAGAAIALTLALSSPPSVGVGHVLGIAPSLVPPPALYTLMLGPLFAPLVSAAPSVALAASLARSTAMVDRLLDSTGSEIAPEQRQAYRMLLGDADHIGGAIGFMAATDLPALLSRLQGLQTASTAIVAEDDRWIPAGPLLRILAQHLPRTPVIRCRAGHLVPEAAPDLVVDTIESLIARAWANGMGR